MGLKSQQVGRKHVSKEVRALIFPYGARIHWRRRASRRITQGGFRALGKDCLAMDPASPERSNPRNDADVPQNHREAIAAMDFFVQRSGWCSLLLFCHRHDRRRSCIQCDQKSQYSGLYAIARAWAYNSRTVLAIRPRLKVEPMWFSGEGHRKPAHSHCLCSRGRTVLPSAGLKCDETCLTTCRPDERHLNGCVEYVLYYQEDRTHLGSRRHASSRPQQSLWAESKIQFLPRLAAAPSMRFAA